MKLFSHETATEHYGITMVLFPVLFFIVAIASRGYAGPAEIREQEVKIMEKCKESTQASQDAVDQFINMGDLDESHEGKCLVQCGIQTFGAMNEDGTINKETSSEYLKQAFPANHEKVTAIWEDCQTKEEMVDDHCEYAHSLVKCFITEIKKQSIERE